MRVDHHTVYEVFAVAAAAMREAMYHAVPKTVIRLDLVHDLPEATQAVLRITDWGENGPPRSGVTR